MNKIQKNINKHKEFWVTFRSLVILIPCLLSHDNSTQKMNYVNNILKGFSLTSLHSHRLTYNGFKFKVFIPIYHGIVFVIFHNGRI
jgi:hypothetical protein